MNLELLGDDDPRSEHAILKLDNSWQSPQGGWLSVQNGSWAQTPAGISLDARGGLGGNVATLRGLNFFLSKVGDKGTSLYPDTAGNGTWRVLEVSD